MILRFYSETRYTYDLATYGKCWERQQGLFGNCGIIKYMKYASASNGMSGWNRAGNNPPKLIKCQDCGHALSPTAYQCPHCGCSTTPAVRTVRRKALLRFSIVIGAISAFVLFGCVCSDIADEKYLKVKDQCHVGWNNNVVRRDLEIMDSMSDVGVAFYSPECLKAECIEFRKKNNGNWNPGKSDE